MGSAAAMSSLLALSILLCYSRGVLAESISDVASCYSYAGASAPNNTLCPGSNACCNIEATCLSNRLCHNPGDASGTYVRGTCAIIGWDATCANICLYDEVGGIFPRATQCDDGSWCCNNDVACCSHGSGTFLDATGSISSEEASVTISYFPASGTSTGRYTVSATAATTSSTTASTASAESTTLSNVSSASSYTSSVSSASATPSASTSQTDSSGSTTSSSTQIGLGVGLGVPLVAILAGGTVWMLMRRRRKGPRRTSHAELPENSTDRSPGPSTASAQYSSVQDFRPPQSQSPFHHSANKPSELSDYDYRLEEMAMRGRERYELGSQRDNRFELAS